MLYLSIPELILEADRYAFTTAIRAGCRPTVGDGRGHAGGAWRWAAD